jgi:hypothetical protein
MTYLLGDIRYLLPSSLPPLRFDTFGWRPSFSGTRFPRGKLLGAMVPGSLVLGRPSVMVVIGSGLLLGPVDGLRMIWAKEHALVWDGRIATELS